MIKKETGKPLYITLYDQIAGEIASGRMRKGAKLTPRRTLSEKLGISQNTVDSAYKMLVDTGYAISIPRQGYIVVYSNSPTGNTPWENNAPETVVFSPNGIDSTHINRSIYARIFRDTVYNDGADIFSYVEKGGETELRMAISKYLYSFRGIKCSPEQIIIGAGREYLLQAFAAMMKEHTFITENPCDGRLYNALNEHGRNVKTLGANTGEFDIDALKAVDGNILILEPDARFPRASAMTVPERLRLLNNWDKYIIEVCTDSELCPQTHTPLYSLDIGSRVVYLSSFSRSLCPAIRTSYMVLPYELLEKWKSFHTYYYALSSKAEQLVLAEFIGKGHYTRHIKQMKKIYSEKKQYIRIHLSEAFGSGAEILSDNGGTYLTVKTAFSAAEMKQRAKSCGVKLVSMNSFNVHKANCPLENDFLIIGIGDLSIREIKNGLRLIEGCL